MNDRTLTQSYTGLTPEERVRLTFAASARGDLEEVRRLVTHCPQIPLVGPDPEYPKLLDRMSRGNGRLLLDWVEVSHLVMRFWMGAGFFSLLAEAYESRNRSDGGTEGDDRENPEALAREYRTAGAKAEAECKEWSAVWKGIESAITGFCAEIGLSSDQLFGMEMPLPPAIEAARQRLDPDAPANRKIKHSVNRRLCQAWRGYED